MRDQWHGYHSADAAAAEAQFDSLTAGVVTLRKIDGTTIKVPVEKLSDEDREWIEARRRAKRTP